jgi:GT2 family glycosyltransferase
MRQLLLCELLADLAAQTVLPSEVIVVDQSRPSDADVKAQAQAAGQLNLIQCLCSAPVGTSAARNIGLSHARAELVLMLDDDHRLGPDVIDSFCRVIDEGMDVVKGDIIENGQRLHEREQVSPMFGPVDQVLNVRYGDRQLPTVGVNSGFTIYRRRYLEAIDGFDGRFRGWFDDHDIGYRLWKAGARMCHDPRPVATHLEARGGRRSVNESEHMDRNAARWAFLITHFGNELARVDFMGVMSDVLRGLLTRQIPLTRSRQTLSLLKSWKRAKQIASLPPQMLSSELPEHVLVCFEREATVGAA